MFYIWLSESTGTILSAEQLNKLLNDEPREVSVETRNAALDDIDDVVRKYSFSNWDGAGALPIGTFVHFNSRIFLKNLPKSIAELPNVIPSRDGAIVFEWYRNPRKKISVNINPDGNLYFSSLINTAGYNAFEKFQGNVSKVLEDRIKEIVE